MGALWSAPAKRRGPVPVDLNRSRRSFMSYWYQYHYEIDAARLSRVTRSVRRANLIIVAANAITQTLRPRSAWCGMPSPRVFRGLALALALALTPTASVLGAAAPSRA